MTATAHPLDGPPYQAYAYSYPHKTSYRPLDPPAAHDWVEPPRTMGNSGQS